MCLTKFEPATPTSEWLQTHDSDVENAGIGAIVKVTAVLIDQELNEH